MCLNFLTQINDIIPTLIISVLSGTVAFLSLTVFENSWLKLVLGGIVGVVFFLFLSVVLKFNELKEVRKIIFQRSTNKL